MAKEQLSTFMLKAVSEKDIGSVLNDGGGLRGRVRRNRAGMVTVQFEYKYRAGKAYRTAKVEHWPKFSLPVIRKLCQLMKTDLSNGIDPIDARKAKRAQTKLDHAQKIGHQAGEAASKRTFADAIAQWENLELSLRKDNGRETMRAIQKDVTPILSDIALIDVTRTMLVDILDRVVERGARVMANHLFADLRQFFNFAIAKKWVEVSPLSGLTKEKIGGRQKERDRYLSEEEIIQLNSCLPSANLQRTTELAIWIMLTTCCRVGELSQARWEDIDLNTGEWFIPAGNCKNAKSHIIFLSGFTKEQFISLHSLTGSTDWCFPSRSGVNHICLKSISRQLRDRVRREPLTNRSKNTGTLLLSGGASRTARMSIARWNMKEAEGKALARRTGTAYEADRVGKEVNIFEAQCLHRSCGFRCGWHKSGGRTH